MKTHGQFKLPSFLVGVGVGTVAALMIAFRMGEDTRKYLRERSNKSLEYLNQRTRKLRESAEGIIEKGKQIATRQSQSVKTDTDAEKQDYEEKKRENMGG